MFFPFIWTAGQPKGYGIISFTDKESGEKAIAAFNNKELEDRKLTVDWFLNSSQYNKSKGSTKPSDKGKAAIGWLKSVLGYLGCEFSTNLNGLLTK